MTNPPASTPHAGEPGPLVSDLPSPRRPVTAAVLGVWLGGWAFGLAFMVQQLRAPGPFGGDDVFLLLWLLAWIAAGLGVIAYLAWLLAGRECVWLAGDQLLIRRSVFGLGHTRRWPLESIHHLRTFGREIPPMIALSLDVAGSGASGVRFESRGRVVRFARSLRESEARAIVLRLRALHDFDGPAGGTPHPGEHTAA